MPQFIEADVIQKIATPAEWGTLLGTKIPYKGQIMLVSDSTGKVINIKVGDGTNNFASLEYMFDTIQANVNYIPYTATPSVSNAFTIVGEGTYGSIVVPPGYLGILFWDGTIWSLQDSVELPAVLIDQEIITTSSNAVANKAVAEGVLFANSIRAKGNQIFDPSNIEIGSYNDSGQATTSTSQKRSKPIVITSEMVGDNTISGFGITPNQNNRITIKNPSGVVVYGLQAIQGNQTPVTFNIPSGYVGYTIMFTIGNINTEPSIGYAKTFMWNKGSTALPFEEYKGNSLSIDAVPTISEFDNSKKPINEEAVKKYITSKRVVVANDIKGTTGKNRFDASTVSPGYMQLDGVINTSGGTSSSYVYGAPIFIKKDQQYSLKGTRNNSNIVGARFVTAFDENGTVLPSYGIENATTFNFSSASPVTTVVLTIYADTINNFQLEEGSESTPFEPFSDRLQSVYGFPVGFDNKLEGKKVVKVGDSIVKSPSGQTGFVEQIVLKNNMILSADYAVGGATVTYNANGTNDIVRQVNQMAIDKPQCDFVIFNGQTNDILSTRDIPLGDISNMFDATLDLSTFTGSLEHICRTLKVNFPYAVIIYVRVHKMRTRPFDRQETFGQRALDVMSKWSIPVVDVYKNGSVNTYLTQYNDIFAPDGTHVNTLGYKYWYVPDVEAEMLRRAIY